MSGLCQENESKMKLGEVCVRFVSGFCQENGSKMELGEVCVRKFCSFADACHGL